MISSNPAPLLGTESLEAPASCGAGVEAGASGAGVPKQELGNQLSITIGPLEQAEYKHQPLGASGV